MTADLTQQLPHLDALPWGMEIFLPLIGFVGLAGGWLASGWSGTTGVGNCEALGLEAARIGQLR
jgi:hypothetical protein